MANSTQKEGSRSGFPSFVYLSFFTGSRLGLEFVFGMGSCSTITTNERISEPPAIHCPCIFLQNHLRRRAHIHGEVIKPFEPMTSNYPLLQAPFRSAYLPDPP